MTRSPLRVYLAEGAALLGMGFGAWLIHSAFKTASDAPNAPLLVVGGVDILLCFFLVAYLLKLGLREQEALPRRWIIAGAVTVAGFLGWIAALFVDSERLLAQEEHHRDHAQQL